MAPTKKKVVSVIAALVLASLGTVLLAAYVQGAKNRAEAAESQVDVLVMTKPLGKGSPLTADFVKRQRIPTRVRPQEAIARVDDVKGMVAKIDLLPGDTVVKTRFSSAAEVTRDMAPQDKLQVTIALDPERALGGRITPGDTVAVNSSFKGVKADTDPGPAVNPVEIGGMTHMILHKILVTHVAMEQAMPDSGPKPQQPVAGETTTTTAPLSPTGKVLVTLALDAPSVERVVFTMEHGFLWLALDPHGAPEGGTKVVTLENIYQ